MQPQQVYPTMPPPVPDQPVVAPATMTTDQRIAQENAQVFVFEHGEPELPRQHRVLDLVAQHKSTLAIALIAFVLTATGGTFAFAKIQTLSKALKTQTSTVTTSKKASSSAGGTTVTTPTNDTTAADDDSDADDNTPVAAANDDGGDGTNDPETNGSSNNDEDTSDSDGDEDATPVDGDDPPEDVVTPASTPVPTTPSPLLTHKFTTASWNSNADNKLIIGDQVKTIMGKTQILGLQEVHHTDQRASVTSKAICSSCAYAGYLASYTSGAASASSYPIIWNKASFTQIGSGSSRQMCDAAKTTTYSYAARYATWVKLQSKVNGKQFYVVNTHLMGVGESAGKPGSDSVLISRYKTHMTNLTALINELKAANVPIYVVGRFNVNYRYDHTVKTSYFPYASLGAIGVRSGWDAMSLSGISSSVGTEGTGSRLIDYVFASQRSDVMSNSIAVSSSQYGAGHSVAFYTSTVK